MDRDSFLIKSTTGHSKRYMHRKRRQLARAAASRNHSSIENGRNELLQNHFFPLIAADMLPLQTHGYRQRTLLFRTTVWLILTQGRFEVQFTFTQPTTIAIKTLIFVWMTGGSGKQQIWCTIRKSKNFSQCHGSNLRQDRVLGHGRCRKKQYVLLVFIYWPNRDRGCKKCFPVRTMGR